MHETCCRYNKRENEIIGENYRCGAEMFPCIPYSYLHENYSIIPSVAHYLAAVSPEFLNTWLSVAHYRTARVT